jgi:hypothetical protein
VVVLADLPPPMPSRESSAAATASNAAATRRRPRTCIMVIWNWGELTEATEAAREGARQERERERLLIEALNRD